MAAALAVTPAGRKVTGVTSVPRLEAGAEAGEQPEGHPWLGDRRPGPVDLRDLDEVVHQRDPGEAALVRGPGDPGQPGGGVLAPREAGDLQHDPQPLRRAAAPAGGAVVCPERVTGDALGHTTRLDDVHQVPALELEAALRTSRCRFS